MTERTQAILDMRLSEVAAEGWLFAATTRSGHIEGSTLRKQHGKALQASGVRPFELYDLRHTCLTRWAKAGMDPFTLQRLAGHLDLKTTLRYVHMNNSDTDEAVRKAREVQDGHTSRHTSKTTVLSEGQCRTVVN